MINRLLVFLIHICVSFLYIFSVGAYASDRVLTIGLSEVLEGQAPEQEAIGEFLRDYWIHWAQKQGYVAKFHFSTHSELQKELKAGSIDLLVTYPTHEHYDKSVLISLPYISMSGVLYERLVKSDVSKVALHLPVNANPAYFDKKEEVLVHTPRLDELRPLIEQVDYIYTLYADELKQVLEEEFKDSFELSNEVDPGMKYAVATSKKNRELLSVVNNSFLNSSFSEQVTNWYKYFPTGSNYYSLLFGSYDASMPSRYLNTRASLPTLKFAYIKGGDAPRYIDDGFFIDGYLVNILKKISLVSGIDFKPVGFDDFAAAYKALRDNEVDVFPGLIESPERTYLIFSNPIGHFSSAIASQEGFNKENDLKNHNISQIRNYAYNQDIQGLEGVTVQKFRHLEEAILAVASGETDAYVGDIFDISYQVAKGKLENIEVQRAPDVGFDLPYRIAFTKNFSDALGLINYAIFQGGKELQRESQTRWKQQIHSLNTEQKVRVAEIETWKKSMYAFSVFFLAFIIYWYYAKKRIALSAALEMALEQATEQKDRAEKLALAKSDFLARMSHEIRTPMNGVIGMAETLSYSSLDEKQSKQLKVLNTSAYGLMSLLNDILDYSKLDSGKFKLDVRDYELQASIQQTLVNFEQPAKDNKTQLNFRFDKDLKRYYRFDSVRVMQILNNLLSNAIKFTHQGVVTVNVVLLEVRQNEDLIGIYVKDTGIGIKEDTLTHLFEPFTQAEVSTTREFGGTGLGLSICKDLVTAMNGDVAVSSVFGFGTQFQVTLPLLHGGIDDEGTINEGTIHEPPLETLQQDVTDLSDIRLLVVEDSLLNVDVLRSQLELLNVSFNHAENGAVALELFSKEKYDIVLSDCHMPVMNGFQLAEQLSNQVSPPYLIALTADILPETIELCMTSGFKSYLTKPCNLESLRNELLQAARHTHNSLLPKGIGNAVPTQIEEYRSQPDNEVSAGDNITFQHIHFNVEHILKMCGGDEQIMKGLLQSFTKNIEREILDYEQEKYRAVEFKDAFHKLKGFFLYLGENAMANKIETIECRVTEFSIEQLKTALNSLVSVLNDVNRQVKELLSEK